MATSDNEAVSAYRLGMAEAKRTKSMSPERTEAARRFVRALVDGEFGGNVRAAATATKVSYSLLNEFYRGVAGLGNNSLEKIADYTGKGTDEITGRVVGPPKHPTPPAVVIDRSDAQPVAPSDDTGVLETEILSAFDRAKHEAIDVDLARLGARQIDRSDREGISLVPLARDLLDAAAAKRKDGGLLLPLTRDNERENGNRVARRALAKGYKAGLTVVEAASAEANERARALSEALERGEDVPPMAPTSPKRKK